MPERNFILARSSACGLLLLLLCSGCGNHPGELLPSPDTQIVWPEPPDKPRIRYVGQISAEADLNKEVSWLHSVGELLFGKKQLGVLVAPYAVAVDQQGRLYVTDTGGATVHVFDLDTREYRQFTDMGEQGRLLKPVGLAVVDNWIYVADSMLHRVCVFDKKGKFIFSFGSERLQRPSGIAYWHAYKMVYIADTARHTIDVFNRDGEFIRQIGARGISAGTFNFPTHLWVDKFGKLYVSDTLNFRIQVFTGQGQLLSVFGRQGDRPGNFAHPCGVATDSLGNIYVTDRQFENMQIFNQQGRILMAFGHEGTQAGQFWLPAGVFIDSRNRIYVADSFNKRIQIFELMEGADR